jgi:hypothetical protein
MGDECCADCCGPECCNDGLGECCAGCLRCCGVVLTIATCQIIAEDACYNLCGVGEPPGEKKRVANAEMYRGASTLAKVGEVTVVSATVPVCMGIERAV